MWSATSCTAARADAVSGVLTQRANVIGDGRCMRLAASVVVLFLYEINPCVEIT
jgi:hypothetical protein